MEDWPDAGGSSVAVGDEWDTAQEFLTLAETVSDGVYQIDADGHLVAVNGVLADRTGTARRDLLGGHVSTLFDDETAARIEETTGPASTEIDGVTVREATLRTATAPAPCEVRSRPLVIDGSVEGAIGVVRNRTDGGSRETTPPATPSSYEAITSVLDDADIGVFVLDDEFDVAWINGTVERYFGLDRADVLGRNKRGLIEDTIRDVVVDADSFVDTVFSTYEDNSYVERFECRLTVDGDDDAEGRWLEHWSKPIESGRYASGRIELYYDITGRKRSERHLHEHEQQLASLIDAVSEYAIFMLEPDGTVATWNEGARQIKGYEADEIIGTHFSTFYTDEATAEGIPERNLTTAAEEGYVEDEGWRVREDGTLFWANVVITAVRNEEGAIEGFAKVTRDLTERREYEERLRNERDQKQQLLATSPIAMSVRDADGNLITANERAQELFGLSEREIAEWPDNADDWNVYDGNGDPIATDRWPWVRVCETGERVTDEEYAIDHPGGDRTWLSVNAAPIFDADGELERVVTAAEDITVLKEHERELETELSEILGRVSDAFYAVDEEFRFTHVNDRAAELLQHSERELLGERLWDVFPEAAEEPVVWDSFQTAMETEEQTSYEVYFDPLGFWVESNLYPSETGVSVYFRDVTERVKRERELRESERRYRTLAEQFPNGIVTLYDEDLEHALAAGEAFEWLDYAADDLEGSNLHEIVGDDLAAALEPAYRSALDGAPTSIEVEYGGRQWIVHTTPVADETGESFAGLAMVQDITERKEREQKLENFASIVSHGLRNPLGIAQVYLQMARESGDSADFEQTAQALDRMETIIENLLTTALEDETASDLEPVSVREVSRRSWRNVETSDATLRTPAEGTVAADGEQLQSVFENLFRNAVTYGGDDVTVRVGSLADGFYVEDTGPGIPPEERSEVFEYGYTTRSGTGIGLAVVRDVVDAHGWEIAVTDGSEGGARFEIRGVSREDE